MVQLWTRSVSLLLAGAMLGGCASIIHGTNQRILINSDPAGATATVDNQVKLTTPGSAKLKRGKDHVVVIEKEGYESAQALITKDLSAWIIGNVLFGGLIGLAIDFIDGASWNLDPDIVNATLKSARSSETPSASPVVAPAVPAIPIPAVPPAPLPAPESSTNPSGSGPTIRALPIAAPEATSGEQKPAI